MTIGRTILKTAALLAGASLLPFAASAYAQEGQAGAAPGRGDVITVTARRREESLTDVPVSVTAFSGDQLERLGAQDITFIGQVTPNVTLEVSRGTNTTLSAFIRGVGQQDPVAGFEAGVGMYLDDVYLNRPQAAVLDIYEVERIEVLRGPQGTLYGRNTIGGAVKYVTRGLSDEPEASARVNIGSYSQLDVILAASTPLADQLRVGGSVARLSRSGFGENLFTSWDNYNKHVWAGRVSAELDVTDNFQIRVSADYSDDSSNARQGHRLIPDQFPPFTYPVLGSEYDTRAGLAFPEQSVEAYGGQITAQWDVNDAISLKSITAYREDESTTPIDFDSLPEDDLDVPAIYANDQFSQEFQLQYSGERINGVVGIYYLDANASTVFDVLLGTTGAIIALPGLNAQTFGDVGTRTWSIFGDFTYDLTDRIEVSLGGRYTEDERNSTVLRTTFIGGRSAFFGGTAIPIAETSNFNGSATFDDFSPRFSVAYRPNDVHNIYFTYSQGFKGGSFDPRGQTSAAPDLDQSGTVDASEIFRFMQFDPEEVNSYEIGWKANWGPVRHSVAYFYSDYSDVQVPGSIGVDTDNDGIADTFTGVTTNAGAATLQGIEWEGFGVVDEDFFRPGDAITIAWTLGLIDGEYDQFINAFGADISNQASIQNTPEYTGSATLGYETTAFSGDLDLSTTVSFRGASQQFELSTRLHFGTPVLSGRARVATGRWPCTAAT
jgi:iron complex outermembrane receptor protein